MVMFYRNIHIDFIFLKIRFMMPKLPIKKPDENIMKMNFDDESFDHIFVYIVLEHLEKPNPALLVLKRVWKAGGGRTLSVHRVTNFIIKKLMFYRESGGR